ncbi:hypothetical protein BK126_04515 [Paenibacillus sp. FSL H7-0326]|uniref:hypothetical protein n=1 Tax=Paenibacillus sp. FSL H7-0326 TaxID=1921144 RepID=UPI00096D0351|nr:hypothetical protein [Paenibacillus sp. FSL H7-0326]OMC71366.1 hypothetical protein BK126_04515 [Paenibacillus sp. FSL H7-0326]
MRSIELELPELYQVKVALRLHIESLEKKIEFYKNNKAAFGSELLEIEERALNECRSALNKIE